MPNPFVTAALPADFHGDPYEFVGVFSYPNDLPLPPYVSLSQIECPLCGEVGDVLEVLWLLTAHLLEPEDRKRIGRVVAVDREARKVIIDPAPDGMRAFGCDSCGSSFYHHISGNGYAP